MWHNPVKMNTSKMSRRALLVFLALGAPPPPRALSAKSHPVAEEAAHSESPTRTRPAVAAPAAAPAGDAARAQDRAAQDARDHEMRSIEAEVIRGGRAGEQVGKRVLEAGGGAKRGSGLSRLVAKAFGVKSPERVLGDILGHRFWSSLPQMGRILQIRTELLNESTNIWEGAKIRETLLAVFHTFSLARFD